MAIAWPREDTTDKFKAINLAPATTQPHLCAGSVGVFTYFYGVEGRWVSLFRTGRGVFSTPTNVVGPVAGKANWRKARWDGSTGPLKEQRMPLVAYQRCGLASARRHFAQRLPTGKGAPTLLVQNPNAGSAERESVQNQANLPVEVGLCPPPHHSPLVVQGSTSRGWFGDARKPNQPSAALLISPHRTRADMGYGENLSSLS